MVFWWIVFGVCIGAAAFGIYSMCALSSKLSRQEEQREFQEDLSEDVGLVTRD